MRPCYPLLALGLVLLLLPAPAISADTVYLEANFDDKAIDTAIGTGGPELGEPVRVDPTIEAHVRTGPMDTPSLELQDADDSAACFVRFEFIGGAEISAGLLAISANLWFTSFEAGNRFVLCVREQAGSTYDFTTLKFSNNGYVYFSDADSPLQALGPYQTGRTLSVTIVFDMSTDLYDIWLDDQRVLDDEYHGVIGHGVGSVSLGCQADADLVGSFYVDSLLVVDSFTPSPNEPASWGEIKVLYR